MRNRFNIFTAEEFDDSADLGGDAEVSATDSIEAETQAVEMEQDVAEVEEVMSSTEEAEQVADELTEQVEEQEKVLKETPEEVTEDTVAVAQEAFFVSMSKIGVLKDYKDMRGSLGLESASSPVEKLKLACESVWDFIKALIARIKIAFSKVGELIKKLYIKFLVFFNNLRKKAIALAQELSPVPASATAKLEDDQKKRVINTFKCFIAAGIFKSSEDLEKVVSYVSNVKGTLNSFVTNVKNAQPFGPGKNSLTDFKSQTDDMTKLAQTKKSEAVYAPYYVKGTMKALVITNEEDVAVAKYETISIDTDANIGGSTGTAGAIKKALLAISKSERALKDIVQVGKDAQESLNKSLDAYDKAIDDMKFGTQKMEYTNSLKLVRRAGTNVILDVLLNYIYNMKNVLSISAMFTKELVKVKGDFKRS
jgi:hypothetical protein